MYFQGVRGLLAYKYTKTIHFWEIPLLCRNKRVFYAYKFNSG